MLKDIYSFFFDKKKKRLIVSEKNDFYFSKNNTTETIQKWEDGQRISTGPGNFEWWYFDYHLEDGSTVVMNFMSKRLFKINKGLGPKLELTYTKTDGEVIQDWTFPSPESYSSSLDECDLRMGTSYAKGDLDFYDVRAEGERLIVEARLKRISPSWRPGNGLIYFDDHFEKYIGWLVSVPYGEVSGTIYDKQTKEIKNFKGTGYHDHYWGNELLSKVIDQWIWGRAAKNGITSLFFKAFGSKSHNRDSVTVLYICENDKILVDGAKTMNMHIEDLGENRKALSITSTFDSGGFCTIKTEDPQKIEEHDMLDTFPAILRPIIRIFINPWYFRYKAKFRLFLDKKDNENIVESNSEVIYENLKFR